MTDGKEHIAAAGTSAKFAELQADFYHYLMTEGGIAKKTCGDYVTRLRFLAQYYTLDEDITESYIKDILQHEETARLRRTKYAYPNSIYDFKAGLGKFLAFVKSDYRKRMADTVLSEICHIESDTHIDKTERTAIVSARIGQGLFRKRLIEYWRGCAVSQCPLTWMLNASHIKPWRVADNDERLSLYNGLLLLPNYDKLFDLGYISFSDKGKILYSRLLDEHDRKAIGLTGDLHLAKFETPHLRFLEYHRDYCFLQ